MSGNADASPRQAPAGRGHAKAQDFPVRVDVAAVQGLSEEGAILFLLIPSYPFVLLLPYYSNLLPYCNSMPQKAEIEDGIAMQKPAA